MMKKNSATLIIIVLILVFVSYIVFDVAFNDEKQKNSSPATDSLAIPDMWSIEKTTETGPGKLHAIAVTADGKIFAGGESFIICYDPAYNVIWSTKPAKGITALSVYGDTIYAATSETVLILDKKGEIKDEWGPYEDNSIITSVSSNSSYVAFADAGNKIIMVLDKKGNIKSMIGKSGEPFILPSPYFDAALSEDDVIYVANTGNRRIETRSVDGTLRGYFGEPGLSPNAFCGCCNPAHFALIPQGFVTAEKGINRIKILNEKGEFVEFVNSRNKFMASVPLDVASADGKVIYAANPADSKIYEFRRK